MLTGFSPAADTKLAPDRVSNFPALSLCSALRGYSPGLADWSVRTRIGPKPTSCPPPLDGLAVMPVAEFGCLHPSAVCAAWPLRSGGGSFSTPLSLAWMPQRPAVLAYDIPLWHSGPFTNQAASSRQHVWDSIANCIFVLRPCACRSSVPISWPATALLLRAAYQA